MYPKEMDTTDNNKEMAAVATAQRKWEWNMIVVLAFAITVVAWISMIFNEYVSFWSAIAALAVSGVAVAKLSRCFMRDVAVTCILANAVLLLVYGIFYFALEYAIKMI